MPELPEVETLRRSLEPGLVGRAVVRVRVLRRDMVSGPGDPAGGFSRASGSPTPVRLAPSWLLAGETIHGTDRRGKQLAIHADTRRAHESAAASAPPDAGSSPAIIVQLGMTGTVALLEPGAPLPAHTHVLWTLDNGVRFAFSDPRRFGLVRALPEGTRDAWADLGPDALTIRGATLAAQLRNTRRPIKASLLDQRLLDGVGNIYAVESLFAARIHPETHASALNTAQAGELAREIRRILRAAIKRGGSTIRDYRDGSGTPGGFQRVHKVYGRADQPCTACKTPLQAARVAQRATVWCPACQRRNSVGDHSP
jgi:formamidopyrimidine-DNA glycosylase